VSRPLASSFRITWSNYLGDIDPADGAHLTAPWWGAPEYIRSGRWSAYAELLARPGGHTALVSDSVAESWREGASILFRFLVAVAWMVVPVVLVAIGIYKALSWPDAPSHLELVDSVQFIVLGGLAAFALPFAGLVAAKPNPEFFGREPHAPQVSTCEP